MAEGTILIDIHSRLIGLDAQGNIVLLTSGLVAEDAKRVGPPHITGKGIPTTFALCQELVAPGGVIANIGVHGTKVELHLENLWDRNITITTRLVDTVSTPMLLKTIRAHKLDPGRLITHRFKLDQMLEAYETFGHAADTKALKVIISA